MLRIIGLRPYTCHKTKRVKTTEAFGDRGWQVSSHAALFADPQAVLAPIPEKERVNLYYSLHHVSDGTVRGFLKATCIAFDIDGLPGYHVDMAPRLADIVCEAMGFDPSITAVISSGNGIHVIAELTEEFCTTNPEYFDRMREHYNACLKIINRALDEAGFSPAYADPKVFDRTRIMRLPGSINDKKGVIKESCVVRATILPQPWDLVKASGIPLHEDKDTVPVRNLKAYPRPDTKAIEEGCLFLKWQRAAPQEVKEPEWYAALSILGRISESGKDSRAIAHTYSQGHPDYDGGETDDKLEQALNHGPRTCKSVNETWLNSKCTSCPHWGKVVSPIMIQGEGYIKTRDTGFHNMIPAQGGGLKVGKPNFEDLRRHFENTHPYVSLADSELIFVWNGQVWERMHTLSIQGFATEHFQPYVMTSVAEEFVRYLLRHPDTQRRHEWFDSSTVGKINFSNGVLDTKSMKLEPHSSQYGFRKILPYAFDANAQSPLFDKFLDDITVGRDDLKEILLQFAGYSLSNSPCWEAKALVLLGEGSNGKSTFINVLKALAGERSYTALTLVDLVKETNRHGLDGALFNVSEETPARSLVDSSLFKNLTSGGEIIVKKLYEQPYTIRNKAKLWLLCNNLPPTTDMSHGMFRRITIVPFSATFSELNNVDKHIEKKLLFELPGVFNKVIAAYKRMIANGALATSAESDAQKDLYRMANDSVSSWLDEHVEISTDPNADAVPLLKLYNEYKLRQDSENERPVTYQAFCKRLSNLIIDYPRRIERKGAGHSGAKERVIHGLTVIQGGASF